ncbi:C-type lectin domain family 10 member A-like [Oncorhynchus kisutch]|uniref:C-type lectin domain family 10 member A-like n=1 Tax=Oncorhynchus kisutch TaxID=8019 RepID=A0A8C7GXJ7_ONCKI|nr:C-type lectin domain family 10 member A-like [Oncorhynchus kisutch]
MSEDIYAVPDMTKKVKFNRGEMKERIVDIYVSADTLRDGETSTKREVTVDTAPNNGPGDQHSVHVQWWKRPSGVAAVCLGLLCVLLLAGIIGQSLQYSNVSKNSSAERDQLQTSNNNLTKERDQLQTSYNNLTKERDQLQTSYNNMTKERYQLETKYNNLTKEKDQLQTSYNNLTQKRDQLQTRYNNLTNERDQLQTEKAFLKMRLTYLKQTCPEGWQKFESSWYFLSTETKTWKESREDCLERGADLVIINSDKEQTFLLNLNKRVWIGLTDSVKEGIWKWVDGTPLTTGYWYYPQPDNGGDKPENGEEDCVEIRTDQSPQEAWNDLSCAENLHWICEKVV